MRSLHPQRRDRDTDGVLSLRSVARASSVTSGTGLSAFSPQLTDNLVLPRCVTFLPVCFRRCLAFCCSAACGSAFAPALVQLSGLLMAGAQVHRHILRSDEAQNRRVLRAATKDERQAEWSRLES